MRNCVHGVLRYCVKHLQNLSYKSFVLFWLNQVYVYTSVSSTLHTQHHSWQVRHVNSTANLGFFITFPHRQYVRWCSERLPSTRRLCVSGSLCFSASCRKYRVSLSSLEWIRARILLITYQDVSVRQN